MLTGGDGNTARRAGVYCVKKQTELKREELRTDACIAREHPREAPSPVHVLPAMVGGLLFVQAGIAVGNLASVVGVRPEEALIVTELKAGSEEAFAWLIAQYHQPIFSLVARTLQNPADAPDVTQDIFIKVFRGIASFHGDSSLRTWIYRIALHEASNQRRWWSRHRRQEITIESEIGQSSQGQPVCIKDTLCDERDSPFDFAAHQELRARVEAELREVAEPFRTTLVLRDIEGFAYEEIAEILNVNLGTVKSRLMRGRAQLKTRLAPLVASQRDARGAGKRPAAVTGDDLATQHRAVYRKEAR